MPPKQIQCECGSRLFVVRQNNADMVQIKCPDCLAILGQDKIELRNHEVLEEDFEPPSPL